MSILRLVDVRREIGDFVILDSVSATLARGERVGLVGANGAGKTTLLKMISGREDPDGGTVHIAAGTRIGLLSQEANLDATFINAAAVRPAVRAGAVEVEQLERRLAELESHGAEAVQTPEYARLQERFEALDGYHLDQRVDEALSGLGIPVEDWGRPPLQLSGGEQTRAALARLLVSDPDLLMLDEPTNHLDIAALEWLEVALSRRQGALLVASHDRAFLDAVATRIWELRDRRLLGFRGAYSAYLVQREAADARQRKDAETGDRGHRPREGAHRSLPQPPQVQQAARARASAGGAPGGARRGAHAAAAPGPACDLAAGRRAGAVGRRGGIAGGPRGGLSAHAAASPGHAHPGRDAAGGGARRPHRRGRARTAPARRPCCARWPASCRRSQGFVRIGANVQPGYLAQLRGAAFPGATVLDAMLAASHVENGPARSYLARFLFRGDEVNKPVSELSGGERSRLELALLGVTPANLLLLDEPTNHLDIPAREALETFLRETPAALIVVSHDRRLLESVCQRLWVVEPGAPGVAGRAAPFDGGYREWRSAVADGWTVEGELARRVSARQATGRTAPWQRPRRRPPTGRSLRPRPPARPPTGSRRSPRMPIASSSSVSRRT